MKLSDALDFAAALTPIAALALAGFSLRLQAQSHDREIQRLTLGEREKRGTKRRELILDQIEPLFALIHESEAAYHTLGIFISSVGGFKITNWPGAKSGPSPSSIRSSLPIDDLPDGPYKEQLRAEQELSPEELALLDRPWWKVLRDDHDLPIEFGRYCVKVPDHEVIAELDAAGLPHLFNDQWDPVEVIFIDAAIAKLQELEAALAPPITRTQIFGYDGVHAALETLSSNARSLRMPGRIAMDAHLGSMVMTKESITLHLIDGWFLAGHQASIDARNALIRELRSLVGDIEENTPAS